MITPSDADYVNRSASLKRFRLESTEIVHMLLLETVSTKLVIIVDRSLQAGLKCGFHSSRNKWTFGLGSVLC